MEEVPCVQTYRMLHVLVISRPSALAFSPISLLFRAPIAPTTCSQHLAYSSSTMCILDKPIRSLKKSSAGKYKSYLYLDDPYRPDSVSRTSGSSLWWFGGRIEVIPSLSVFV